MIDKIEKNNHCEFNNANNYILEPNSFSRVLNMVMASNKKNISFEKKHKKDTITLDNLCYSNNGVTIQDKINFKNSLLNYK